MDICAFTGNHWEAFDSLLTDEEIFGLETGRYSGVYAEEENRPIGVVIVQVMEDHILLQKLLVLPEYRNRGTGKALLSVIKDQPEKLKMPIRAVCGEKDGGNYFYKQGFSLVPSSYTEVMGTVGSLKDHQNSEEYAGEMKIRSITEVSPRDLSRYVFSQDMDEEMLFPEKEHSLSEYSDASLVYLEGQKIYSVILLEEKMDAIRVKWVGGEDREAARILLERMKPILLEDYSPDTKLSFLCEFPEEKGEFTRLFKKGVTGRVCIYEWKP